MYVPVSAVISVSCVCARSQTIISFRVPGANRPRNAAEIAQKRLPLRDIREPGFIDYLVNMIQARGRGTQYSWDLASVLEIPELFFQPSVRNKDKTSPCSIVVVRHTLPIPPSACV